jgi:aminopeptidase N
MKNLNDVIQSLVDVNDKLLSGTITIDVAKQISANTQVIINGARLQLDAAKFDNQKRVFIEDKKPIFDELKEIAAKAVELNKEEEEEITDKRPFNF